MTSLILLIALSGQPDPVIIAENKRAARECEERHDKMKKKIGDLTTRKTVTTKRSTSKSRYGGGVGYNGFGGAGGYAGYSDTLAGSAGGIGAMIYNFGFGYANQGNAKQEDHDETIEEYDMIYRDRNYYGGPLTVRNPYAK